MSLSHPALRDLIKRSFLEYIDDHQLTADVIAGVATGGVPYGALIADEADLPFVYVRSQSKGHGRQNTVEGDLQSGQKCVVIEDLVSTGASSMKAVVSLREAGAVVTDTISIFTYGFDQSGVLFQNGDCSLHSLVHYDDMITEAHRLDYIKPDQIKELKQWRQSPSSWKA